MPLRRRGADHTAGNAFGARKEVNPLGIQGQKELSLKLQIISAMLDSTGLCLFARPPVIAHPQLMADMITGAYGWAGAHRIWSAFTAMCCAPSSSSTAERASTAADYRIPNTCARNRLRLIRPSLTCRIPSWMQSLKLCR